ncbi:MAG: hypothetical protein KC483_02520 [Nitrosarchaeum sp.]|nr:hypothetical protein [Nitrosarchaeum sp.]
MSAQAKGLILTPQQFALEQMKLKYVEMRKKQLREQYDSMAEVQRRNSMTTEERTRGALQTLAKNIKLYHDNLRGTDTTMAEAEKKAHEIARRVLLHRA